MWKRFVSSVIVKDIIFEYFKLVELAIVVLGSVEDECFFFYYHFHKVQIGESITTNMDLVVRMYAHDFFTL
jgi:hypothetical protein